MSKKIRMFVVSSLEGRQRLDICVVGWSLTVNGAGEREDVVVHAGSEDLGLLQVQAGLAWHFLRYAADQHPDERIAYARAEREARARRAGLWRDTAPVPPWQHRQRQRAG